jgi:hypothetical protein
MLMETRGWVLLFASPRPCAKVKHPPRVQIEQRRTQRTGSIGVVAFRRASMASAASRYAQCGCTGIGKNREPQSKKAQGGISEIRLMIASSARESSCAVGGSASDWAYWAGGWRRASRRRRAWPDFCRHSDRRPVGKAPAVFPACHRCRTPGSVAIVP